MDKAAMFAAMEADEGFYEEFLAFRARQQDQCRSNLSEAAPASEPDRHTRSPTFGCSSDPVPPRDDYQRGRSMQRHAPTSSRGPGRVSNGTSRSNSASPPRHPKTVSVHTRGQSMAPPLPRSTPPPLPRSDNYRSSSHTPRDPSPHRRDYSAPRNPPATSHRGNSAAPCSSSLAPHHNYTPTEHGSSPTSRRGCSPTPRRSPAPPREHLPRRSPARRERSPCRERSPAPRQSRSPHRNRSPAPLRSRLPPRRRDKTPDEATGSDNEPANPDTIEYDTCPTSYEMRFAPGGKRLQGGRKKDAQGKILYTHLEKLITRKRKHEYIKRHPHPFGKKYNMYFNPYSGRRADIKCYKQVPRPVGVQIGRGGFLLHEAIGTRGDYEFTKGMMLYFRKGLLKFRPSVTLEKGKTHTWSHYGSSRCKQLHDYMYDRYPFLQHFSDESGEDCWVITMMAQRYLGGSGSYLRKEGKTGGRGKNIGEEEEEEEEVAEEDRELGGPEASAIDPDDYEDDYAANTSHHPANAHAPRARPQTAQPSSSRPRTNVAEPSHASAAQPTSTQHENHRADKVVAEEEACAKAAEARAKDKGQSLAATSSKAKGKRRADPPRQPTPPPPSIPRRDESDDDELVIRTFSKKVKAGPRNQARITSPEASPAPAMTNKKGKAAQAPKASRKRKADNAPPTETEPVEEPREPAAKKARIRPNMRLPPPPEPEPEPEHEHEPEPKPERAAPTVPAIPTSNIAPQDEVINISSSDQPEAGSSRAPITVSSSDPPDGANVDATPNTAGLRVVHARKMKVPVPPVRKNRVYN